MIKRISKTSLEIYREKYPKEVLETNYFKCVEAIGYLKCLMEHVPSTEMWANTEIMVLTGMALISIKESE